MTAPPRSILAVRGGALGDFVVTMPALDALRRRWPDAELHLLTRPAYGRLAVDCALAHAFHNLEAADVAPLFAKTAKIPETWRRLAAGFEVVVSWLPDPDGTFQRRMLEAGAKRFVQGPAKVTGPGPAAQCLAALPPPDALALASPVYRIPLPPRPRVATALHPGSGSPSKNWPLDRWLDVLRRRPPAGDLVLITGEAEHDRLPAIEDALRIAGIPFRSLHARPPGEVAAALSHCRLLLGHDSGIAHLAAAAGTPCRLLFGPTDPQIWAPPDPNTRFLQAPARNLADLSADTVLAWLDEA